MIEVSLLHYVILAKKKWDWYNLIRNDLVYKQVLWPIEPEVDLWYLGWDCLCVYTEYRINNLKWEFLCILSILKWLKWCGTPCNIHKDERILKYDHNHFIKNIFPQNAIIKFYKGDKK